MLIFITKLIKTTIPKKYRIVHWWVVHLESKLRRLVDWLHPSTCVLHNHVFHCLHSKVERAISHIFLKGEDIHNFFASCILKHSLKLENKSVSQWHVDHSHSSRVRWESKHTRGNFFLTLVWITIRVVDHTRHLKTSSFRVAKHPLSTHLKLLAERSLDIYVKTIYYFLLFHHSSFVADRFKWIWFAKMKTQIKLKVVNILTGCLCLWPSSPSFPINPSCARLQWIFYQDSLVQCFPSFFHLQANFHW